MKTNHRLLRTYLKNTINPICDNAFFMQAPDSAAFPYITYEYKTKYGENEGIGTLEINVWDKNGSSERVEELADELENGLNQMILADEYIVLKMYSNTRLSVTDPDKNIKRRMLTFDMQFYFGKEQTT